MSVMATDNFDRANGGLGASWTTTAGFNAPQIASNVVNALAVAADACAYYSTIVWPNDQWSEIKYVSAVTSAGGCLATVRTSGADGTFYTGGLFAATFGTGKAIRIERWLAGAILTIATGTATVNAGDVMRLEAQGTTLSLRLNGRQVLSVINNVIASGSAGLFTTDDTGLVGDHQLDNWQGGNFKTEFLMPQVLT